MLNVDLMTPTSLQMEAHLAHKERHLRMMMAARRLLPPLQIAPPPKPKPSSPAYFAPLPRQHNAHVLAYISDVPARVLGSTVQAIVCGEYHITKVEMSSRQRSAWLVKPRQIAFYLTCRLTGRSLPEIGRQFGGKDHTTVLHGRRKVAALMALDADYADRVRALEEKCLLAAEFERFPRE